ncbi:hypothetical protein SAMN04488069_110145 [Hymenobacter psychrophilus]|uniref:Uncharacterized protein n=1 Tax=Hymenobacter psychrophilus TaxID=651662 RepID=A0A1H3L9F8_9BACT|nr:hypothetical protein SAMN04488069_110145 [Hymenobacter psychrophilus]
MAYFLTASILKLPGNISSLEDILPGSFRAIAEESRNPFRPLNQGQNLT